MWLVACGGSGSHASKPEQPPAEPEKPDPYWEWHKARPKSPAEPVRTSKFTPPQQCGQGPYAFAVDTLASQFEEGVEVTLCTPNGFKGSFSYQPPAREKTERGFGEDSKHQEKCRVDATVVAARGSGGAADATPTNAKVKGKGTGKAAKPAAPTSVVLSGELVTTNERCPDNTQSISMVSSSYYTYDQAPPDHAPPLPKGAFKFELWSELPNDLSGVTILVRQRGTPAGYTVERWREYRKATDAWYAQREAKLAESIANGHQWRTVEPIAPTKQPPPARTETPPPRPSAHAAWIPGYWHDADGWVWSAGFWRVPQEDIEQEKTVEAPAPPPAPKVDTAPQPDVAYYTARRAVWTPGYWMWNGAGYIWITGSWRIPEATGMTWVAPTWRPTRRGTSIYVPGGFVRLRRR